jgi:diaminopimelate decarboxylase
VPRISAGKLLVGEVPASELVERFGTPLYAYDAAEIRRRHTTLAGGLGPEVEIYYSVKANPALGIVSLLKELGARADACSPGDLAVAGAAGIRGEEVSFAGHALSDADLDAVAAFGAVFVADSIGQIERYGRLRPGAAIGLRLNCGIDAGFHPHVRAGAAGSKFGIHPAQIEQAASAAERASLRVAGLHAHVGSDVLDSATHARLAVRLLEAAERLPNVEWINLGGGFGVPFLPDDHEYDVPDLGRSLRAALDAFAQRTGRSLRARVEPGGYLVMTSGFLLARVTEIKESVESPSGPTPRFVALDTSHNHVVSAVIYGTQHPVWAADAADAPPVWTCDVVGNLMQAGDVIARGRALPDLAPGDVVAIGRCGGYSASRAPVFNERPRPAEVLVDGGAARFIRRAETVADLLRFDVLPPGPAGASS